MSMALGAVVLVLVGCVESRITSRPRELCQPGETRECVCDDGILGISSCMGENAGFGACVCEGASDEWDSSSSSDEDSASEPQSSLGQDTGPGTDDVTDSALPTDSGQGTELSSDTQSESGETPQDTEVANPGVGVECGDSNPCGNDLECFAGYCMDDLGSFQWGGVRDDVVTAIAIDGDDNIYLAGSKREANPAASDPNDPGFQWGYVMKLSPKGTPEWSKEFGTTGSSNIVYDMAVDTLDNIYVVGESRDDLDGQRSPGDTRSYMYIAKYDSSGNRQWIQQSTMVGLDWQGNMTARSNRARGVALDPSGDPWVAGTIVNNKIFFTRFSKEDGVQGTVTELCQNDTYSYGNDIFIDPLGEGVFVLGSDDRNAVLYKFSIEGTQQWRQEWKSTNDNNDAPQSLTMGMDGALYVVGHSELQSGSDIFVTKIDKETSVVQWTTYLSQFPHSDYGWDVAPHPSGGVYITGALSTNIALVRFDAQHEWHFVASPGNTGGLNFIIGDSYGGPPSQSGLPVGSSGDFFYDTSVAPASGVEHGLYNNVGSIWKLVASQTVVSGLPRLYLEKGEPSKDLGMPGDFYADEETGSLYEKQTYSRDRVRVWSSGDGSQGTSFSEQGNKLAIDSQGNIFIAAQTTGDFRQGTNSAPSNNTYDSLLLKFVP
jgi:hypothetical protein